VIDALEQALGGPVERVIKLAGGASKEAWAVDTADGRELLVRRAGGGVIHLDTLTLQQEFEVLVAAREAGVRVPEPLAYLGDLDGREAFVMERVHGETIGRRIVKEPPAVLGPQMAEELAKIHSIPLGRLTFLPHADLWQRLYAELDSVDEPHPAIELGIAWCRERIPLERAPVVGHGDFRIGNLMADEALRIVEPAVVEANPDIYCASKMIQFPIENDVMRYVLMNSPISKGTKHNDDFSAVSTQVNLLNIGKAQVLTIPGEALPNIGFYVKRHMKTDQPFLFGLTNDAFGYMLTKEDFNSFKRYEYITRTSLGEMTGEIYETEALKFIAESPVPKK